MTGLAAEAAAVSWQAALAADRLEREHPGAEVRMVPLRDGSDRSRRSPGRSG